MTLKCNIPLSKFKQMLASAKIDNPRFNISQFEKYYGTDCTYCMLVDGDKCLAAATVMKDGPSSKWTYLNEIQCLVKGYGSKMLKALIKHYKDVWLMADPTAGSSLLDYYRRPEFGFEEHVVPASGSFYGVDTHIFSTRTLPEQQWMDWLMPRFYGEKEELQSIDEDGNHINDYYGKLLNIVLRAYQNKYGIDLYHMQILVDEQPRYNNGEPCYEMMPEESAGNWTTLGWIRINPDLKSVMQHYNVDADETEFAKNIIAHELAHEVWNNIATDDFKHEVLDAAKKSNFTTKYLQTIENPSKLPEETFCEWLAKEVAPVNVSKYEPPYTLEQIKANYPNAVYVKLANDPVHRWRAETGIELIHKEPDEAELDRIWKNWQLMSDEMKDISDEKSIELFGCTNEQHYNFLKDEAY